MLFLPLLLAHTLSFGKSLKNELSIWCLETVTSPPHSLNALRVPKALSYSLCKLVFMFTCLTKSKAEINSWKSTLGDSLKRHNRNTGWQKQLLLLQAAHLHRWENSYRIRKVSWKPNLFVRCCLFVQHDCLEGARGRNNPVSKWDLSLTQ